MSIKRQRTQNRLLTLGVEQLDERRVFAVSGSVLIIDPASSFAAYHSQIRSTLLAAANDWGQLFPSSNASIELGVEFTSTPEQRGGGRSETTSFVGKDGVLDVFEQSIAHEIRTGSDPNGATLDGYISLNGDYLQNELWFDPTPTNRADEIVPADKTDAYTVMLHELAHAIAFNGWRDYTTGALPGGYESTFDRHVVIDDSGTPFFRGPSAMAAHGNQPVPLTYSNIMHFGNDTFGTVNGRGAGRPGSDLIGDLMNGVVFHRGARYSISTLDKAVLQDVGVVTSYPWHNPVLRYDVDEDSLVAPNDALSIINSINANGSRPLPWREPSNANPPFYDVIADNILAPNDALEVINYINAHPRQTSNLSAEGEAHDAPLAHDAALHSLLDSEAQTLGYSKPRRR